MMGYALSLFLCNQANAAFPAVLVTLDAAEPCFLQILFQLTAAVYRHSVYDFAPPVVLRIAGLVANQEQTARPQHGQYLPEAGWQSGPEVDGLKRSYQVKGVRFKGQGRGIPLKDPASAGFNKSLVFMGGLFHTQRGIIHSGDHALRKTVQQGGQIGSPAASDVQGGLAVIEGQMGETPLGKGHMSFIHHMNHQFPGSSLGFACVLKKSFQHCNTSLKWLERTNLLL